MGCPLVVCCMETMPSTCFSDCTSCCMIGCDRHVGALLTRTSPPFDKQGRRHRRTRYLLGCFIGVGVGQGVEEKRRGAEEKGAQ